LKPPFLLQSSAMATCSLSTNTTRLPNSWRFSTKPQVKITTILCSKQSVLQMVMGTLPQSIELRHKLKSQLFCIVSLASSRMKNISPAWQNLYSDASQILTICVDLQIFLNTKPMISSKKVCRILKMALSKSSQLKRHLKMWLVSSLWLILLLYSTKERKKTTIGLKTTTISSKTCVLNSLAKLSSEIGVYQNNRMGKYSPKFSRVASCNSRY